MEQHQSGNDQSLARSVSMAAEANEAAIAANAALAQMRRNLGEIRHLYPVIDDFHERIIIVNGRLEDTFSQTERLLAERPGPEIGTTSERTEGSFGEDELSIASDDFTPWKEELRDSRFDDSGRKIDSDFERSEGGAEL